MRRLQVHAAVENLEHENGDYGDGSRENAARVAHAKAFFCTPVANVAEAAASCGRPAA